MITAHTKPMLLTPANHLPEGDQWVFEPKLDGIRCMTEYNADGPTRMITRNGTNVVSEFPEVVEQLPLAFAGVKGAVLDGELIGFDPSGHHDLQTLPRGRRRIGPRNHVVLFNFDLLRVRTDDADLDLTSTPWDIRRGMLDKVFTRPVDEQGRTHIDTVGYHTEGWPLFQAAYVLGLEGIVAIDRNSLYLPGKRHKNMRKIKFDVLERRSNRGS